MRRRAIAFLVSAIVVACGGSDASTPPLPKPPSDDAGGNDGGASTPPPPADWIFAIDPNAPPAGITTNALLGHYDLSGSLFRYDAVPNLATQMKAIGFPEWRVGVGRWEVSTQLLPTLTDGSPCALPPGFPDESKAKTDELGLIASRDWFVDTGGIPVTLADTANDARYKLDYLRSVIDIATKSFGASAYVNIDHMPRAFSVNRTPSRLLTTTNPKACEFSWTNRVSNAGPADAYLATAPGAAPPIFAAAVVGLVKRIVEGSGAEPGRPVKYWELWNEPDLPYAWDRTLDDAKLTRFFTMAAQVMVLLDAYRKGGSTNPAVKDLKFGLASFAIAKVCADVLTALDQGATPVPVDVFSFHSYSNDPLVIADDIKTVVSARAASSRYKNAELALTEWGPDLEKHPDPNTMEPALIIATALILGATLGLERAHHSILWDFYAGVPFGVIDHDGKPKKTYTAYKLLSETIREKSERLSIQSAPDGRVDGGLGAVLAVRDPGSSGADAPLRLLLVNRGTAAKTVRVDLGGVAKKPTTVSVFGDANVPPWTAGSEVFSLPPRSIVKVTY